MNLELLLGNEGTEMADVGVLKKFGCQGEENDGLRVGN